MQEDPFLSADGQIGLIISCVSIVICLLLSAFFSGSETAFTSLSPSQIGALRARHDKRARLVCVLNDEPRRVLTTVLVGNNLVNIIAAVLATNVTIRLFGDVALGATIAVLTLIILIFGEVSPKQFAVLYNESWALRVAPLLSLFSVLLWPAAWLVGNIGFLFMRIGGAKRQNQVTREGILHLINHATSVGVIERLKSRWVRNVFRFGDTKVEAIMTHRMRMFIIDGTLSVQQSIPQLSTAGYARVPVYNKHSENITGVVLLKDVIRTVADGDGTISLNALALKPLFVPETQRAEQLLTKFRQEKLNLAIVLDEYGGVSGLVTQEDIIEEIMGELYDERDPVEAEKIRKIGANTYLIAGDTPLTMFNEWCNLAIPADDNVHTLGGYLISITGSIPNRNEQINTPYGCFTIQAINDTRIGSIRFRPDRPIVLEEPT